MDNNLRRNLSNVLFEVEKQPIFIAQANQQPAQEAHAFGMQISLFQNPKTEQTKPVTNFTKVPRLNAVVDIKRNHVFSIVSDNYQLITNEEAVELGMKCFRSIFSEATSEGLEVFNIIMPKSRSFCHIDFFHKDAGFEPWKNDKWSPFLRITNSYNRSRSLRFDLGFCRWICKNGMIFDDKSITFNYFHTRREIARTVEFKTNIGDLKKLEADFIEKLHNLKRFYIPEGEMLPLTCKAFDLQVNSEDLKRPKRTEQLFNLKSCVGELTQKYFKEMGPNGYAALNVITDFATRPQSFISPAAMADGLQKRCANWTDDFIKNIKNDKFGFDTYLADYRETVTILNSINKPKA